MKITEKEFWKFCENENITHVAFSYTDREAIETICNFVLEHAIARRKHPVFASRFYDPSTADVKSARQMMHELQKNNNETERRNRHNAIDIIMEELVEAFIAYVDGDLEHCLSELHQLGGCVISAVKMIEREIQNRKENMKRRKPKSPQRDTVAKKGLHIHTNSKAKRKGIK